MRSERFQEDTERRQRGGHPGRRGHGGPHGGGRGFRGAGGWQQADLPPADDAAAWFAGRLPQDWFVGSPTVSVDRDEILVVGKLPAPEGDDSGDTAAAAQGRISRFREESRDARIRIAAEAEARYGRKVAWGASIGDTTALFSHVAVPTMTRLRHDERRVLDTLVDAGVARSRSDALAWCVRLVGEHTDEWLTGLREAMTAVDKLRATGPEL
ncbi:hypothetical protein [uncultured Jatrophihabitans sp.]|uniref:hypothetical protein n=1 Tax=uncultured Jatrophihabitans sp. TaxID=1610747 RepID=UPI0035CC14C6